MSDRGSARCSCRNPIVFASRQHGPDRARHFVDECDGRQHPWHARQQRCSQLPSGPPFRQAKRMTAIAPIINRRRMSRWPILEILPRSGLPPVECCRGTTPSQAAKTRAASEDGHRRRESLNRHRCDRSHARHGLQAAHRRSAHGFLNCRLLEFGDCLRQFVDLAEEDARELHDEKRKGRRSPLQALHVRRPSRRAPCLFRTRDLQVSPVVPDLFSLTSPLTAQAKGWPD